MLQAAPFNFRDRAAAIFAAFSVASAMAFGGVAIAPTAALANATSPDSPVSTQRPVLAGSAAQGSVITSTPGTFSNETAQTDTWYRCPSASSLKCTATTTKGNTYTLGTSDPAGGYVRLDEVATNASGTNTVWSNAIGPITAKPAATPAAAAASAAAPAAPVVTVSGNTLSWQALAGVTSYHIATILNPTTTRNITYQNVSGTSFTPPAAPGQTVNYGVEANVSGAPWAKEVTITYPAAAPAAPAAPALTVSSGTLHWTAMSGVSSYRLATILNPTTTRNTTYQTVTGTSYTPAVVAGQTVNYGLQANVANAPWSKEVTITASGTVSPPPSSSSMLVGLNESGWGASAVSDVASSFNFDRVDISAESANDFWPHGLAVDALFSGPYNTGGVSAINPTSWAQNTLSTFQSQCGGSAAHCPAVEVLNEPYGSWFWGANATSSTNEAAYAHLLVDTWTAFHNQYGSASPKIVAAFSSDSWWQGITAAVPNIGNYVDGVSVHPYGQTGSVASSALGDRGLVVDAHQTTGKPLWISEFGWPTAVGQPATGDSLQWTFSQQATNTYNFVTWLRSLGYVAAAADFNYRDYGTNNWYGVETHDGVKKPSWTALAQAANQQPCTVCN